MKYKQAVKRVTGASVCAVALGLGACGAGGTSGSGPPRVETQVHGGGHNVQRKGPVRSHQWGVADVQGESIRLIAFVTYCQYTKPKPDVDRVERRHRGAGIVLTMFVQFPPHREDGGCLGVQESVSQWVKVGKKALRAGLYDGSISPPKRNWPPPS